MRTRMIGVLVLAVLSGGCASVVNFRTDYNKLPVDSMKAVALEIEQAVQKGERERQIADREGIVVNTESLTQAIRTRAARSELFNQFLDSGHAWEQRNGLVYIIRDKRYRKATTSRDRDRDAMLIMGENGNRWTLYEGILKSSHMSPKNLSTVRQIFFEARHQTMRKGQIYEDESGNPAYVGGQPPQEAAPKPPSEESRK